MSPREPGSPARADQVVVDLARALAADLRDIAVDLTANAYTRQTLAMLQLNLHRLVPSAHGAVLTLRHPSALGCPVSINLLLRPLEPYEIAAALRIPLEVIDPSGSPAADPLADHLDEPTAHSAVGVPGEPVGGRAAAPPCGGDAGPPAAGGGSVVFYAGADSAFDTLVCALAAALDVEPGSLDQDPDLPQSSISPGISGLADFSMVNRAVGVLVNRGYDLTGARAELRRRADHAATDLPEAALALLDSFF